MSITFHPFLAIVLGTLIVIFLTVVIGSVLQFDDIIEKTVVQENQTAICLDHECVLYSFDYGVFVIPRYRLNYQGEL